MAVEFACTDCGGDAYIGMSNLIGPRGQMIGRDERLCMRCTRKRGGFNPLAPNDKHSEPAEGTRNNHEK